MSKLDLRAAIVAAVIGAALPYPVRWPNSSQKDPKGETWIRGEVVDTQGTGGTLGPNGRDRFNGSVVFTIYTPRHKEEQAAYEAIVAVENVIKRGAALQNGDAAVRINTTATRPGPTLDSWYTRQVRADFTSYIQRG